MKKLLLAAFVFALPFVFVPFFAEQKTESPVEKVETLPVPNLLEEKEKSPLKPAKPNADVKKMLAEIRPANIEATIKKLVTFGSRNTLSEQNNPTRGIGAARDYLFDEFNKISKDCNDCLTVEKQAFEQPKAARIPQPTIITNVVATLKGQTNPDRFYVVSGHYDSMCKDPMDAVCDSPGANDDASGVAAVLEMARVMSKRKFDASIIFMAVAGEEQGLLGAAYFAEQAKQKSMNIEAMFTNDIIGSSVSDTGAKDARSVRVFSEGVPSNESPEEATLRKSIGGENDAPSRQLARFVKETAENYVSKFSVRLVYRRDRYLRGGDHIPFLERGFAAVRFCEPNEDYRHQHQNVRMENGVQFGDLPEFCDYDFIAQVARANAANLAQLANAPAKPKNVVLVNKLSNDTELKWDANADTDLANYEIVWRETTSPVWTNSQTIANVATFTMKNMSKDNFLFGVRAVDKNGNKSPVVFPKPIR